MKGIQNTSTENFSTIIGTNRKFIVPKFQRDYSWENEQWDDLWMDIISMLEGENDHYMGYLVLQTLDNKTFYIIDGQQRFTTITLLIIAAIKSIKMLADKGIDKENNLRRVDNLLHTYVGNEDPVTLEYDNILILNRNNDPYYKDYIVKMDELRVRNTTATEKLMKKGFEFFESRVQKDYDSGESLAAFVQRVVDNLFFTTIIVNDEMNAFRVFETLNARGVQLSSSDLLKNYLFSIVDSTSAHDGNLNVLESRWAKLTNNVKTERLPEFLRYYWNATHKLIRANEVFKTIRKEIKTDKQVFLLLKDLLEYSDIYMALRDSEDELWGNNDIIKNSITLLKIFSLKQPYALLMSARRNLSDELFSRVLRDIIIVCFRYITIGDKNPNEIERTFNEMALNIASSKQYNVNLLRKVYIEDPEFVSLFKTKTFPVSGRNMQIVRYILAKLEYASGNMATIDYLDEKNTIEHIMPQSPDEAWNIEEENAERLYSRLGNLTLLERSKNKDIGNAPYLDKIPVYRQSSFNMTSSIPDSYSVWDENSISSRQARMSSLAKSIWRISF